MARRIEVEIIGDASSLQRELRKAEGASGKFGSSLGGMAKMAALGAGAAGVGALIVGLKSSIGAAQEAEKAQARLEQALGSANVSFAKHGKAIDEAIQKTSRLAAIDDEDLSDAFAKLIRTTGDVTKATEGMALAADIARARNISLEASTKMVEKAQAGQESAFSRVGIILGKNQDATDALRIAQERFGGAAEKYGNTSAAAQERLGVAFENLQEKIGAKLLPVFASFLVKLTELVEWVEENWPRIEDEFERTVAIVKDAFDKIRPIIANALSFIKNLVEFVKALIEGDWSRVWEEAKQLVAGALKGIVLLLELWLQTIGKAALALGQAILGGVVDGVKALPMALVNLFLAAIQAYVGLYARAFEAAANFGKEIGKGIITTAKGIPDIVRGFVQDAIDAIGGLAGAMFNAAMGLGQKVVSGLRSGLAGVAGSVASGIGDAVRSAINYLIDRINSALEFRIRIPFGPDIKINPPDIPHLAAGVRGFRGGLAVVGERGPEIVRLPKGSDVIPNDRLATAGGTVVQNHFHIAGSVITERQVFDIVKREENSWRRRNGGASAFGVA
jgi:phage-related protein